MNQNPSLRNLPVNPPETTYRRQCSRWTAGKKCRRTATTRDFQGYVVCETHDEIDKAMGDAT